MEILIAIIGSGLLSAMVSGAVALVSKAIDKKSNTTGGSAAHNNMPPYLAVYMWKRTA